MISIKNKRLHPLHPIPDTLASSLPINVTTPAIIMEFSKIAETITLLVLCSIVVTAAPIPQGAGAGEGCDGKPAAQILNLFSLTRSAAILTDGDTGSGMAVKEAGQNAASLLKSAGVKRQGAGVGEACNAILTDGDTGSGMAVKEAGQNAASLLQSAGARRQLDKVGAGTPALVDLADPDLASYQEGLTDTIDGDGTSDSAVVGEQLGGLEVEAGEGAGNLVPSKLPAAA